MKKKLIRNSSFFQIPETYFKTNAFLNALKLANFRKKVIQSAIFGIKGSRIDNDELRKTISNHIHCNILGVFLSFVCPKLPSIFNGKSVVLAPA